MKALIACSILLAVVAGSPHKRGRLGNYLHSFRPTPKFSKIVGGNDAGLCELKYQISLQDISFGFPYHLCGGSIINENWVVTAAHCFDEVDITAPGFLQVVAGEHNLIEDEGKEQTIILKEIRIHEKYDKWTVANDIALLRLSSPITLDDCSQPIALPDKDHLATGDCVVSGWGTLKEEGHPSDILQKATIPMMSDADCKKIFGETEIDGCMICAGVIDGGVDACEGDSGGPLACQDTGAPYLAGIVSWGYGCGRPGYPGVYAEVSCYVDWINDQITK
ncbi:trypsin-1-like [Macrobrachium rosenbergii]|uniref:trypsin-1-like n=1 Tax=Macrobrachium rosenbergii TaxID=79674 RepID=UPI0034D70F30